MEILFQLLSPLIFTGFAIGFVAVYRIFQHRAVLLIGISYLYAVAGFLLDIIYESLPVFWGAFFTHAVYAVGTATLGCGIQYYYSNQLQVKRLAAATILHLTVTTSLLIVGDPWKISFAVNIGVALIFAVGVTGIQKYLVTKLDRLLFAICMLCVAQNIARPIIIASLTAGPLTVENYSGAVFINTLHICIAVCAICLATTLLMIFVQRAFAEKQRPSSIDGLTGLLNQRGLQRKIGGYFASDTDVPASIILADIDRFAVINENFGHTFGDSILISIAKSLSQYASRDCFVARIGGEKFAIIAINKTIEEATDLAEMIRRDIVALASGFASENLKLTASFGVSEKKRSESFGNAMGRADEALYASKAKGRNRVNNETSIMQGDWVGRIAAHEHRRSRLAHLSGEPA